MRGKIGAGKSFEARRLCAETGARLLSVDFYMESVFGGGCLGRERHMEAEGRVLRFCLEMAKELDGMGKDAVIDHGFWTRKELETAEGFLKDNGIEFKTLTVKADFETRLRRVESRTDGKRFDRDKLIAFDGYYED